MRSRAVQNIQSSRKWKEEQGKLQYTHEMNTRKHKERAMHVQEWWLLKPHGEVVVWHAYLMRESSSIWSKKLWSLSTRNLEIFSGKRPSAERKERSTHTQQVIFHDNLPVLYTHTLNYWSISPWSPPDSVVKLETGLTHHHSAIHACVPLRQISHTANITLNICLKGHHSLNGS